MKTVKHLREEEKYFKENVEEAKADREKAVELYLRYVGKAETAEEREIRIHKFRSGGSNF